MKLKDLLLNEDNQISTNTNNAGTGTTSDAVSKWMSPVKDGKGKSEVIKRVVGPDQDGLNHPVKFIDYAIGEDRKLCPACEFIKKNKNAIPVVFNSKVKCFLCDKEFTTYPKKDVGCKDK